MAWPGPGRETRGSDPGLPGEPRAPGGLRDRAGHCAAGGLPAAPGVERFFFFFFFPVGESEINQGFMIPGCLLHMYLYIYISMHPPPPWTLVLLPFGDGKSRISKFMFSKFPIVGPQSVIIWSPESSTMSQYDTLSKKYVTSTRIGFLNIVSYG